MTSGSPPKSPPSQSETFFFETSHRKHPIYATNPSTKLRSFHLLHPYLHLSLHVKMASQPSYSPTSSPTISGPPSPLSNLTPTTSISREATPEYEAANHLDDVFGASPPHSTAITSATHTGAGFDHFTQTSSDQQYTPDPDVERRIAGLNETSEIPLLRRQHITSGYRDGVASAKSGSIQAGFDEGYPVGANLGLRVGIVLGSLEGLAAGFEVQRRGGKKLKINEGEKEGEVGVDIGGERNVFLEMLKAARRELAVEKAFEGIGEVGEGGNATWKGEETVRTWEEKVRTLMEQAC